MDERVYFIAGFAAVGLFIYGLVKLLGRLAIGTEVARVEVTPNEPFELTYALAQAGRHRLFLYYELDRRGSRASPTGLAIAYEATAGGAQVASETVGWTMVHETPVPVDRRESRAYGGASQGGSGTGHRKRGSMPVLETMDRPVGTEIAVTGTVHITAPEQVVQLAVFLAK